MPGEQAAKSAESYATNSERYRKEGDEIQNEARKLEGESEEKGRKALRMHFGEIFLEIGIVFASLAILSRRKSFWFTAMGSALVGALIAGTSLMGG
jgi:hypothetical protein